MPGQDLQEWAQQLAGLVILAGCAYMAAPHKAKSKTTNTASSLQKDEVNINLTRMFPPERIEAIKRKALRRYKVRQDTQWERWMDSVSR